MSDYKSKLNLAVLIFKKNISRLIAMSVFLTAIYLAFALLQQVAFEILNISVLDDLGEIILSKKAVIITALAGIVFLLIGMPLRLGAKKWCFEICFNKSADFTLIFEYFSDFKKYIKAIKFIIIFFIKRLFYYLILVLPFTVFRIIISYFAQNGLSTANEYYLASVVFLDILIILAAISAFYFSLKYFSAEYIFFKDENLTLREIGRKSDDVMKERKGYIFKLNLLLLPFYALCIFIFPIIILIPYRNVLFSVIGKEFLKDI